MSLLLQYLKEVPVRTVEYDLKGSEVSFKASLNSRPTIYINIQVDLKSNSGTFEMYTQTEHLGLTNLNGSIEEILHTSKVLLLRLMNDKSIKGVSLWETPLSELFIQLYLLVQPKVSQFCLWKGVKACTIEVHGKLLEIEIDKGVLLVKDNKGNTSKLMYPQLVELLHRYIEVDNHHVSRTQQMSTPTENGEQPFSVGNKPKQNSLTVALNSLAPFEQHLLMLLSDDTLISSADIFMKTGNMYTNTLTFCKRSKQELDYSVEIELLSDKDIKIETRIGEDHIDMYPSTVNSLSCDELAHALATSSKGVSDELVERFLPKHRRFSKKVVCHYMVFKVLALLDILHTCRITPKHINDLRINNHPLSIHIKGETIVLEYNNQKCKPTSMTLDGLKEALHNLGISK